MSKRALKLDLRVGESVSFNGGQISIKVLEKSGQRARLSIEADDGVQIKTPKSGVASQQAKGGLTIGT